MTRQVLIGLGSNVADRLGPPITAVRALGQAKMKRGSNPRPHMP